MMEVILILKFRQKMIKRHVFLENFKDSWLSHRSLRGEGFVSILTELGSVSYSCLVIRGAHPHHHPHHHYQSILPSYCLGQVLGQRMVESIRAFLVCFPPPTSQCMCSKVSQSNNINMTKKQNNSSTKKNIVATTTKGQKNKSQRHQHNKIPKTVGEQLQLQ